MCLGEIYMCYMFIMLVRGVCVCIMSVVCVVYMVCKVCVCNVSVWCVKCCVCVLCIVYEVCV